MKRKAYIVDGNSLLFRSYYATAYTGNIMRTSDGTPTNAIYTFHKYIKTFKNELTPNDFLLVLFDTGKKNFRHEQYENYKAQRKPIDEDLKVQMPIAREMLDAMNVFHLEIDGYEGDDLAGSFAKIFSTLGIEVFVYTSDKDFLQLIDENVSINLIKKGLKDVELNNIDNFYDHYGLTPSQVIDYKAIAGDPSDNYKGVKGVGEKTVLPLLQKYKTLENIYEHLNELPKTMQDKFVQYKNDCFLCQELAKIKTDIDLSHYISETNLKKEDIKQLKDFYDKYEFKSYAKQLEKNLSTDDTDNNNDYDSSNTEIKNKINSSVKSIESEFSFSVIKNLNEIKISPTTFMFVQYSLDSNENLDFINGLILADNINSYYISIEDLNVGSQIEQLKSFFEKSIRNTYDLKKQIVILNRLGINVPLNIDFDYMLCNYILKTTDNNLMKHIEQYSGVIKQSAALACFISTNKEVLIDKIKKDDQLTLLKDIEQPLSVILAKMEIEGVNVDLDVLKQLYEEYSKVVETLKDEIVSYSSNKNINLNSPKQVHDFLFEELKLGSNIKSKSTSFDVLKYLTNEHEVAEKLILYRKYTKIITSYLESIPRFVSHVDNKIHTCFNQALTQTGRLSSSEPNLQNISVRDDIGREIRKAFYAPNGYFLLSLDYSQIELRMLASLAHIKSLIDVFNKDIDIHTATASKIFNVPLDQVTPLMRRHAKAVNFGIIYGITVHGLSSDLQIPFSSAKQFIDSFNKSYPEIQQFQNETIEFAKKHGYVKTITNRIRYLDNINSTNFQLRSFSERAAVNTIIQGSAADLIKIAMINIDRMLTNNNFKTKLLIQIHDELIFLVPNDEKEVIEKIKYEMENALVKDVKFKVEATTGLTWYDLK